MERIELINTHKLLEVRETVLDNSSFRMACLERLYFENVNMKGTKIINANLSDLEISDAQIGGAYIRNVGMPPEGHPAFDPTARQRPVKFENCNLEKSEIVNCNLTDVELNDCKTSGMKINGILVDDLMKEYKKHNT